ncbi:conserved hypothetical protein [Leishmania braziliensis MHOM/BR/75/M2904]|uniref:Uncharacterized protein n=2 Tax=Leishmania braziliensis TaxID=5660 RepID=A4H7V5_LEIBR|nr:conserved hypothetical protein [Leishmania braziliensis MHOM/BR/75/M2904]CAJ2468918.1 unnamed protein product [Leishmania braziliensis]CAM37622.1 conserved hypothetical protein [Leishmania braziliensis MHOM/BR/75/M2904]
MSAWTFSVPPLSLPLPLQSSSHVLRVACAHSPGRLCGDTPRHRTVSLFSLRTQVCAESHLGRLPSHSIFLPSLAHVCGWDAAYQWVPPYPFHFHSHSSPKELTQRTLSACSSQLLLSLPLLLRGLCLAESPSQMPLMSSQESAVPSSHLLSLGDGSDVNVTASSTASPASPRNPRATVSNVSHYAAKDVEAVELDPAALWAVLDLPAPESMPSQHTSRRVVLLGRPLSGKRTLCRRLCFAAQAQYAGSDGATDGGPQSGGVAANNDREPLYHPSTDDDEDSALFPNRNVGGCNMPGAYSTVGTPRQCTGVGPQDRVKPLSHGSGVCFDYVVQRVPTRLAHGCGGANDGLASGNQRSSTGFLMAPLGGTVRRTTEFFCCDNAGALSMALPTLDHVESGLVLMVIDVSDVSTIRQQLDYCYSTLESYIANLLRTQAPSHDEVRRMQLAAAQQEYWFAEEQKLRTVRANLASGGTAAAASSSSLTKEGLFDASFTDSAANIDKANSTPLRVPASAGTVCTMRSVIVCTKVDSLERASRAIGLVESGTIESEALLDRLGIPGELRLAMRHSLQSLLCLVSQLVRQYAIYHRAALASVCLRVSMTTAGAEGEYANSALVNPFYKGFWAYIAYLLYSSEGPNASVPSDVLRVCSARMYPHALLPCGLDSLALLNHFVTSSNVQLPEGPSLMAPEDPADSAIRTTAEGVITPDGVFLLHQKYIQQAQADLTSWTALWGNPAEAMHSGDDMVWDTL